jgi:hypothetical protein
MPITSGFVSYERRVKTGDFEHKHSAVTVHYAVDVGEDADALISLAGALATHHVFQALLAKAQVTHATANVVVGGAEANTPVPVADPQPGVIAPASEPVVEPGTAILDAEGRVAATWVVAPAPEVLPPVTNLKAAKRAAAKKTGPVTIVSQTDVEAEVIQLVEEIAAIPPFATPPVSEIVEDFVAEEPAASDAELGQALSRVAAKLKDRPKIQALIGEFVQSGQSYTLIPNSRRAEFITKLEALA